MVDVDAIRAMIDSDPAVRAQEARIASEARNAASLQVDKQMAEASEDIRSELSRRGSAASDELAKTQEAALAELEARSDAVLRAEAKMREIAAEREALEAEAGETQKKKWGASVGTTSTRTPSAWRAPRRRRAPRSRERFSPRPCCSRNPRAGS
jgi:chromosome segregation ATPase